MPVDVFSRLSPGRVLFGVRSSKVTENVLKQQRTGKQVYNFMLALVMFWSELKHFSQKFSPLVETLVVTLAGLMSHTHESKVLCKSMK